VGRLEQRYGALVTRARIALEIDAPVERTWEVVSDPRNLPHWDKHIVRVEGLDGGPAEGVAYTTVMRFMAVQAAIDCLVRTWDPPHRSVIELSGLLTARVATEVTPIGRGGRCRLEHDVEYRFRGGPLGEFAAGSLRLVGGARLALRHGALAQKRQIEAAG
jgi:uncharacterized protein YndB with AHSA1/START domain